MAYRAVRSAGDQGLRLHHARGVAPAPPKCDLRPLEQGKAGRGNADPGPSHPERKGQMSKGKPIRLKDIKEHGNESEYAQQSGNLRRHSFFTFFQGSVFGLAVFFYVIAAVQGKACDQHGHK